MSTERLNDSLLAELRVLEAARSQYQVEHPATQLCPEDPDVRRLIEALAYGAVRTRHAMMRNLHGTWRRLLSGYFNFMLQPLPAMTMAQALVTARMSEATTLPRGTTLQLTTLDGFAGSFVTLAELRVVPMTLVRCETLLRAQGFRLVLSFASQYPRADAVGLLPLHIQYLNSYLAGLRVHHNLKQHLKRVIAVYDSPVHENTDGPECAVTFGAHYDEPYENDAQNPLERVREFFHFPEQELLINVQVPPSPHAWTRLSLCFDLSSDWPRDPPVYKEIFCPFTVPVANLRRSFAQPISCDGTQDSYPIRYVMDDASYALHRVRGVYRSIQQGIEPLRAVALDGIRPNYELEESSYSDGRNGYSLMVRMPEAFGQPQQLLVDATWYQPDFAQHAIGPIRVTLQDRNVRGLEWQAVGALRSALDSQLRQDPDRLLYLLALKMKPVLERDELLELLRMFGTVEIGAYRELPQRLRDMSVEVVPDGRLQGAGIRHLYHVHLPQTETHEEALVARFLTQIEAILDAWDYEARAELVGAKST